MLRPTPLLSVLACALFTAQKTLAQPTPTYDNVVFGTGTLDAGGTIPLHLDLYRPAGATNRTPLVLWIHGGGWHAGSYNTIPDEIAPLLEQGVSIASVQYRLSGEAIFPAQIHDVKGAVRFLPANAQAYGINPLRIGAWGRSAGGHLTALLATSGGVADAEGSIGGNLARSSRILAAADYFGPTAILNIALDFTTPPGSTVDHDAPTSPESRLIGFDGAGEGIGVLRANQSNPNATFPQKMALATLANPITHASFDDPIILVAHGTDDTRVPIRQSQKLSEALSGVNVSATYVPVPGAGHGDLGAATDEQAIEFLVRELTRTMGDANRDGHNDVADLGILATNWQQPGGWAQGDFNSDGSVNVADLGLLASNWQAGSEADLLTMPDLRDAFYRCR